MRLSRKKKGSKRRGKARKRVATIHYRIRSLREDAIHQMTAAVVKAKPALIVLEDLNVRGMVQNRRLVKSVMDTAFGEARRQLQYKTAWIGSRLHVVSRWFPSSKRCLACGHMRDELPCPSARLCVRRAA